MWSQLFKLFGTLNFLQVYFQPQQVLLWDGEHILPDSQYSISSTHVLNKTAKILLNSPPLYSFGTQKCKDYQKKRKKKYWKIIVNLISLLKCIWLPRVAPGSLCPKSASISIQPTERGWGRGEGKEFQFSNHIQNVGHREIVYYSYWLSMAKVLSTKTHPA